MGVVTNKSNRPIYVEKLKTEVARLYTKIDSLKKKNIPENSLAALSIEMEIKLIDSKIEILLDYISQLNE
ncbi:hypothetical protein [Winogradskyella sp.]|uniref:hypothetical protein n=1 Tax=Winogradskyella sp. TaxID=1883156 RepID=UPI0026255FD0|nr:hypothetical protein [Winogradskyella sp.]